MKPRLESVYFRGDGPNGDQYERLARVLDYTASLYCGNWDVRIRQIAMNVDYQTNGIHSHVSNTEKLIHWNRIVQEAPDGAEILVMDADMMILRPIDDVWKQSFDMAYTTKRAKLPFNGGVIFLRVSDRTKTLMAAWLDANMALLRSPKSHQLWRKKYGGMNQAAFGQLLPRIRSEFGVHLIELPCREWNCEQSAWHTYQPEFTRIVHIKSGLRRAVLGKTSVIEAHLMPLVKKWRELDKLAVMVAR